MHSGTSLNEWSTQADVTCRTIYVDEAPCEAASNQVLRAGLAFPLADSLRRLGRQSLVAKERAVFRPFVAAAENLVTVGIEAPNTFPVAEVTGSIWNLFSCSPAGASRAVDLKRQSVHTIAYHLYSHRKKVEFRMTLGR